MARMFTIFTIIMLCCFKLYAGEFRLFNHQSRQYKAWMLAKHRLIISQSAIHVGIPKDILLAVCFAESSHRQVGEVQDGVSSSYGICQVKLETALFLNRYFKIKQPVTEHSLDSVKVNSFYAALYLLYQYRRYGDWVSAIESFNKGSVVSGPKSKYVKRVLAYKENF